MNDDKGGDELLAHMILRFIKRIKNWGDNGIMVDEDGTDELHY